MGDNLKNLVEPWCNDLPLNLFPVHEVLHLVADARKLFGPAEVILWIYPLTCLGQVGRECGSVLFLKPGNDCVLNIKGYRGGGGSGVRQAHDAAMGGRHRV